MKVFVFVVIFATSIAITLGRVAIRQAACPETPKPKCGDSIYCHNLSKDNNGCPAPDFCAVIPAGTYIFYKFRMIIEY